MRSLFFLIVAAALQLAVATSNDSDSSSNSTGGLSGGAIAGIIVGSLAGVGAIGGAVYYFYLRPGASMASKINAPAPTARHFGDNNLPMVALRVNGEDDI